VGALTTDFQNKLALMGLRPGAKFSKFSRPYGTHFVMAVVTQTLKPSSSTADNSRALIQSIRAMTVARFETDTGHGKVLDTRQLLNYKAK
jgi:hypothetical protein